MGSIVATCSLVLPTLILMILISKLFMKYMNTIEVQSIFSGLRPAVVGLLAAATLLLMNKENFGEWNVNTWQFCISVGLFVATYVGTKVVKINPYSHDFIRSFCRCNAVILKIFYYICTIFLCLSHCEDKTKS